MQDAFRGGCSPRLDKCKVNCAHRRMIMDYRVERHRQVAEEEEATLGYETELRLRRESGLRPITFQEWLMGHRAEQPGDAGTTRVGAGDLDVAYEAVGW